MAEKITKENSPEKHEALKRIWKREGRPGHLVLPRENWKVMVIDDQVEFWPEGDFKDAYGSSSF